MDLTTQFVRIVYGNENRIVTFYQDQPLEELRDLLTALFPDVSSGHAVPVGVERPTDNLVVPLSAGAKFPEVMTGVWHLLCVPQREIESEKMIIREFTKGMYAQGFIGERVMKDLLMLVEEADRPLLAAYRSYRRHQNVRQLKEALVGLVRSYRAPLLGGEEMRIANKLLSMTVFMMEANQLSKTESRVLSDLIMSGDSTVFSAYEVAKIDRNIGELQSLLCRIATSKTKAMAAPDVSLPPAERANELNATFDSDSDCTEDTGDEYFNNLAKRRAVVLRVIREYDYLREEEKDMLENLGDNAYIDAAIKVYDDGGSVELLLESLRKIAQTATSQQQQKDELPPRPGSPTPYSDDDNQIVEQLFVEGYVNATEASKLRHLLAEDNVLVRAAIDIYKDDGDFQDLQDTLSRVIELFDERASSSAQDEANEEDLDDTIDYNESDSSSGVEVSDSGPEESGTLDSSVDEERLSSLDTTVDAKDKCQLLIYRLSNGTNELFTKQERETLLRLLEQHGTKEQDLILSAYELYESDGDHADFADTLKRVVTHLGLQTVESFQQFEDLIAQMSTQGLLGDNQSMLSQLVQLFRQGDARVSAAWDVLVDSGDVQEFADTLGRIISRLSMEDDFRGVEDSLTLNSQSKKDVATIVNHMVNHGRLSGEEGECLSRLIDNGDSIITTAFDFLLQDKDIERFMNTLKNIAENSMLNDNPSAVEERTHLALQEMTDLNKALRKSQMMTERESEHLQALIDGNDSRVMAAYDVYYDEQDIYDLMDTVKRIVRRVSGSGEEDDDEYAEETFEDASNSEYTDDFERPTTDGDDNYDRVDASSNSSSFANDSAQAVKGWSQGEESDPTLSASDGSQSESAPSEGMGPSDTADENYSEDFEPPTEDERESQTATLNQSPDPWDDFDGVELCIEEMLLENLLQDEEATKLMAYSNADERILQAYDKFLENKDLAEFADGLRTLLVTLGEEEDEAATAADDANQQTNAEMEEVIVAAEEANQKTNAEMEEVIDAAEAEQQTIRSEIDEVITAAEAHMKQMKRNQEHILERSGDVDKMASLVKRKKFETSNGSVSSAENFNAFYAMVNEMDLSAKEINALENSILESNPSIRAAMKVFGMNKDTNDLKDTLKRIARNAADDLVVEDIEDPTDFGSVMNRLEKNGSISSTERESFEKLMMDQNDVAQAAYEVFELDNDEEEMLDTLRRINNRAETA
jgi:hypothetical protein